MVFGLLTVLVPLLSGCGGGGESVKIKGKVTLNDHPLGNADLQFFPPGNTEVSSFAGKSKDDGTYEVIVPPTTKLAIGTYKVTVTKYEAKTGKSKVNTEGMDITQLKMAGLAVNSLPSNYATAKSTSLTADIKPGEVTADLKLNAAEKK